MWEGNSLCGADSGSLLVIKEEDPLPIQLCLFRLCALRLSLALSEPQFICCCF